MATSNILAPELSLFSIKNPRLQHIFNEERDDLEKSFADIKKVYDPRLFKYEALISFWLAVHLQKLDFVQMMSKQDVIIEKVVDSIWTLG